MNLALIQKWNKKFLPTAFLATLVMSGGSDVLSENLDGIGEEIAIAVEFENTSSSRSTKKVKYYLPSEVTPRHIVSSAGLKVEKDAEEGRLCLSDELEFEANEIKRFVILVKNVWKISTDKFDEYLGEASGILDRLQGTAYEELGGILFSQLQKGVEEVKLAQREARSIQEHIAVFRGNEEKVKTIWQAIDRLRELNSSIERQSKSKMYREKIETILLVLTTFLIVLTVFFFMGGIMSPQKRDL